MVFIKLTALEKNIYESIPNMEFKHMGWLWLSLTEAETEKTPNFKNWQRSCELSG